MGRVTLRTVADEVGVSPTTVSNAYSRPDQLSEALRRRILEAAHRLGYPGPNAAARSLRRGRAGAVGVLFTERLSYAFTDPYSVGFMQGLSEAAEEAVVGLLLVPMPHRDEAGAAGDPRVIVGDAVVDSFCIYGLDDDHPTIPVALQRGLPVVIVDEPRRAGLPFVGIDERAAGYAIGNHLLELGHRRLGVLAVQLRSDGRAGWVDAERVKQATMRTGRERLLGVLDACAEEGLALEDLSVYEISPHERDLGRRAASRILDQDPRPTAIVAFSDLLALGAMDAAAERGLEVPADLSVTGFDDLPAAGRAGLTTIRQPMVAKGRAAGQLLLDPDRNRGEETLLLPHTLVVRATTRRPARPRAS